MSESYEEKIINGVLQYKNKPDGQWKQFTLDEVSEKYISAIVETRYWKERFIRLQNSF